MPNSQNPPNKFTRFSRIIFIIALSTVTIVNIPHLYKEILTIKKIQRNIPFHFDGLKFSGLESIFKNVTFVGYYTDKNIKHVTHAKQFAQAQLILAPTILDLNNTTHKYILFDCSSDAIAFKKIKEIGAIALKKNQFGIILAKKP